MFLCCIFVIFLWSLSLSLLCFCCVVCLDNVVLGLSNYAFGGWCTNSGTLSRADYFFRNCMNSCSCGVCCYLFVIWSTPLEWIDASYLCLLIYWQDKLGTLNFSEVGRYFFLWNKPLVSPDPLPICYKSGWVSLPEYGIIDLDSWLVPKVVISW